MKLPHPAGAGEGLVDRGKPVDTSAILRATGRADPSHGRGDSPGSTARAVADAAVVQWNAVAQALVPIIGQSSVTMLYRRCLAGVGIERTWLPAVTAADLPENDWTVLHASLSRQTPKEASAACASLFVAFRGLLGSLIGPSLTEQLLHPVSSLPSTSSADQDTLP